MGDADPYKLLAQAESAKNYKSWLGGNKLEDASDLYQQAATAFKIAKKYNEAGQAYIAQAEICIKLGEKDEASNCFINASKAYKKTNPNEGVRALEQAVELLTERGRFQAAANNQKAVAEIYEMELEKFDKAMQAYELAAEWYQGEDSNAQASACNLKAATLAAQLEHYIKAVEKFEAVASQSLENNLTKWSVREYLLKAGICILCSQDYVRAHQSFERYAAMDMTFSTTREFKFLKDLLDAVEASDVECFTNVIVDYDKLTKLDNWKTTLLLRVKKSIAADDLDFT